MTTVNDIIDVIARAYSNYKSIFSTSCKEYFLSHPIANLLGAFIGPILIVFLIGVLSKDSKENMWDIIRTSLLVGGVLGIIMILAMVIPCALGANVELTGDIAVGVLLGILLWSLWFHEVIESIIYAISFILFYGFLMYLKHQ
jgi:hypothetical protein